MTLVRIIFKTIVPSRISELRTIYLFRGRRHKVNWATVGLNNFGAGENVSKGQQFNGRHPICLEEAAAEARASDEAQARRSSAACCIHGVVFTAFFA
jgi:hypothetical protein